MEPDRRILRATIRVHAKRMPSLVRRGAKSSRHCAHPDMHRLDQLKWKLEGGSKYVSPYKSLFVRVTLVMLG